MTARRTVAGGVLERIGESRSRHLHRSPAGQEVVQACPIADHRDGMQILAATLHETGILRDRGELSGIGHRVVHGGNAFSRPAKIDLAVIETIRAWIPWAPLHNPANIVGIEAARARWPEVVQVAVFDTAFHQTLPPHARTYALPHELLTRFQIRRYGFHGTSHACVAKRAAAFLGKPLKSLNLITLHLGNGASAAAIQQGSCVDTSMGMTPMEGLVMGTRCGDLDPGVVFYLCRATGKTADEIESVLNRASGMKGLCGENDMREVLRMADDGDAAARLALDLYAYRIKKYLGAYIAVLGNVDAIVFTGGIGENSPPIRHQCCERLHHLGIAIDPARNSQPANRPLEIQTPGSPVRVLVVPTDEEWEIAEATAEVIAHG